MDIEQFIRHYPFSAPAADRPQNRAREQQMIAQRYAAEETLLSAIASGNDQAAFRAITAYGEIMSSAEQQPAPTSENPLRDFKNSVLVMNTLFRKAVERAKVHPIYIHEASSELGTRIEQAQTMETLTELIGEMLQTYCSLVREYSLASYSAPVQKAIIFMDLNLSEPISTREIAADQFITPNYLSARFKQETGKAVTEYLLERRIALAKQLLAATGLSVQAVAASVGMDDGSYFSKQFKRVVGKSPLQFRAAGRGRSAKAEIGSPS